MNRVTTNCPACVNQGERGSCSRLRCYCGHPQCWAYDTRQPTQQTHIDQNQAPATTGAFSYPEEKMKRDTRSAYRARAAATERSIDAAIAERKAAEAAEQAKRAAAYAERTKPVPFTREELEAARAVRTAYGWHRVIRVNAKTVTVVGDFGDHRVLEKAILEVRA